MNLEKLYADNYKMVYYICLKFLKNPEDAQDMTQNVFIKAFDKIDTLSDINKFSPWVRQIANRECLNELQKKGRITAKEESLPDEELNYLEDKQKNPEDMAVEDDVRDIMLQIIDGLSMDQRIAVYLYYYQDMTVKEISQVFNCSEKTTRSRLAYARKNMKKEIEKLEDKGVKLRALNILPFLYLIFQAEAKMVYADIETIEYKAGFEQATEEKDLYTKAPKPQTKNMTSFISTLGGKIAIAGLSIAVVVGTVIAGKTLIGNKNDDNKETVNKEDSSSKADDEKNNDKKTAIANAVVEHDKAVDIYGNNIILYYSDKLVIKDFKGEKEDVIIPFTLVDVNMYYNVSIDYRDGYIVFSTNQWDEKEEKSRYYITILSEDGNVRIVRETNYEYGIDAQGNVIYSMDGNVVCINPLTGEEVYNKEYSEYHVSLTPGLYFFEADWYVCKSVDASCVYDKEEVIGTQDIMKFNRHNIQCYRDFFVVYEQDETKEITFGDYALNYTCYDYDGNEIYKCNEPVIITYNSSDSQFGNYMFITKEIDGKLQTGVFGYDMSVYLDYSEEMYNNIKEKSFGCIMWHCKDGSSDSVIICESNERFWIISNDEVIECVEDELSYSDENDYLIMLTKDGRRLVVLTKNFNVIEVANEAEVRSDGSTNDFCYESVIIIKTGDKLDFYSEAGELIVSYTNSTGKSSYMMNIYTSDDCNKILYETNEGVIIYDIEKKEEVLIEQIHNVRAMLDNRYIIYLEEKKSKNGDTMYDILAYDITTQKIEKLQETKYTGNCSYTKCAFEVTQDEKSTVYTYELKK